MSEHTRRGLVQALAAVGAIGLAGCSSEWRRTDDSGPGSDTGSDERLTRGGFTETDSEFFATVNVESASSYDAASDGDLWPSCWADDGYLYAANGDGKGFAKYDLWADIVVNQLEGTPETGISGERLAASEEVGKIWADPNEYNRKPTGMVAVDGNGDGTDELYLAYQDLRSDPDDKAFDDAPNASISKSTDYGETWEQTDEPLFTDYEFTTIFFLDYGQSYEHVGVLGPGNDEYVYAYGLDHNWRCSFSDAVEDPTHLYLARVPADAIQDRDRWEFFAGTDGNGNPTWNPSIDGRVPVLEDDRRVYENQFTTDNPNNGDSMTAISQGSVVYNAPLDRYLYTSWTEYTFEFYEAPEPWGPWRLFMQKDFGSYPWFGRDRDGDSDCPNPKNGGYATTIPSKFISDDGTSMWVQSNWWEQVDCGDANYNYSCRKLAVAPFTETNPTNEPDSERNLAREPGTVPIEKSAHYGHDEFYNSGDRTQSEDSWDGTHKALDFWGYTWEQAYNVNRVVYTTGEMFEEGGWFVDSHDLHVQVRRDFDWVDVTGLSIDPTYPYDDTAGPNNTYTFTFDDDHGDGIRLIGTPGGAEHFTSIAELEVYFD